MREMACTKTVLRAAASVLIVVQARAMAGEADSSRRLLFVDRFRDPVKAVTLCIEAGDSCQPVATAPAGTAVLPPELFRGKLIAKAEGFVPRTLLPHEDEIGLTGTGVISVRLELLTRDETAVDVLLVRQGSAPALRESRHLLPGAPQSVRFADLPPGSYRLTASGPQLVEERRTIDLSPSRQVDLGILPVRRGRLIEGMVLEAAGLPIQEAAVELVPGRGAIGERYRAVTKDDGLFSFAGVPWETAYEWKVRATGWRLESGLLGGENRLYVVMTPASRITGRVVSQSEPIPRAKLSLTYVVSESPRETATDSDLETDVDGGFTLWRSRDGDARVEVRAPGYRPARRELEHRGSSTPPRDEDLGTIELSRGRIVEGVVRRKSDGAPLAGVTVLATTPSEPEAAAATTDADGLFSLSGLPEKGRVALVASISGFAKAIREIPDTESHVEIALSTGSRIEGRTCASAREVAETRFSLSPSQLQSFQIEPAEPDASGRFVFDQLEPGTWVLGRVWRVATGPKSYSTIGTSVSRVLSVSEGIPISISIGCDGPLVSGRLLSNGQPVREAYAELAAEGRPFAPFRSDEVGHFAVRAPSEGLFGAVVSYPMIGSGKKSTECYVPREGTVECSIDVGR